MHRRTDGGETQTELMEEFSVPPRRTKGSVSAFPNGNKDSRGRAQLPQPPQLSSRSAPA